MPRYKISIAYDGAPFQGFQRQPNRPTIQGAIEEALHPLNPHFTPIHGASRTDAGVHAIGQIAHFDLVHQRPCDVLLRALNARLPRTIRILSVEETAPDFHARFDAKKKIYTYTLSTAPFQSPFHRFHSLHFPYPLDFDAINQSIQHITGRHDFASFANTTSPPAPSTIRELFEISYTREKELLVFSFTGNGFLYNMVRNLMGALLEVGQGNLSLASLKKILSHPTRNRPFTTQPAHALVLQKVIYT